MVVQQAQEPAVQPSVEQAFTPGLEGAARQALFNRVSKHYDEVSSNFMW
jgi:hypothetical protein